jgi:hypothetical protein
VNPQILIDGIKPVESLSPLGFALWRAAYGSATMTVKFWRATYGSATMTAEKLREGATLSTDLPDRLKIAIADAIIAFARLEAAILECLWLLKDPDIKTKQDIGRAFVANNVREVRELLENITGLKVGKVGLWKAVAELADERNTVAHATWMMNGDQPIIVAHKWASDGDGLVGPHAQYEALDRIRTQSEYLFDIFVELRTKLDESSRQTVART